MNEDATDIRRLREQRVRPDASGSPAREPDGVRTDGRPFIYGTSVYDRPRPCSATASTGVPRHGLARIHGGRDKSRSCSSAWPTRVRVLVPASLRIVSVDSAVNRVSRPDSGNAANPDVSNRREGPPVGDQQATAHLRDADPQGGPVKRVTEGPAAFGDAPPAAPRTLMWHHSRSTRNESAPQRTPHIPGRCIRTQPTLRRLDDHLSAWRSIRSGRRTETAHRVHGSRRRSAVWLVCFTSSTPTMEVMIRCCPRPAKSWTRSQHDGLDPSKWWQSALRDRRGG